METIMEQAVREREYTIELRRYFHRHPELGGEEFNTSKRVAQELKKMGL